MKSLKYLFASNNKGFLSVIAFILVFFAFLTLQAQPFSSTPMPTQLSGGNVGIFPQFTEQAAGVAYTPFSPFSPSQQNGLGPVLYGPGGTPIGGLPTSNGNLLMLGLVIIYSGWRFFKRRRVVSYPYGSTKESELQQCGDIIDGISEKKIKK